MRYQVHTATRDGSSGSGTAVIEANSPEDATRIYANNEGTTVRAMTAAGLEFHIKEV